MSSIQEKLFLSPFYIPDTERAATVQSARERMTRIPDGHPIQTIKALHLLTTEHSSHLNPAQTQLETDVEIHIAGNFRLPSADPSIIHESVGELKKIKYRGAPRVQTFPLAPGEFRKIARIIPAQDNPQPFDLYKIISLPNVDGTYFRPPTRKVNQFMNELAKDYVGSQKGSSDATFLEALSKLYLTTVAVVHPFVDGNARAMELFLEREMRKRGLDFSPVVDSRGKIDGDLGMAPRAFSEAFTQDQKIPTFTIDELTSGDPFIIRYDTLMLGAFASGIKAPGPKTREVIHDFAGYLKSNAA